MTKRHYHSKSTFKRKNLHNMDGKRGTTLIAEHYDGQEITFVYMV